jgi:hypothetical protein
MLPPKDFRDMADEARTMASEMRTSDAQDTFLLIAKQYDQLAKISEREHGRAARAFSSWASPPDAGVAASAGV